MDTTSFWAGTTPAASFPPLAGDIEAEVVVVGGGITGISAAHLLERAGSSVVVLEAGQIGRGTTGYSTGNLYATVDENLYSIAQKWGQNVAAQVAASRSDTINAMERTLTDYGISCEFQRVPHYIFPTDRSQKKQMEQEYEAAQQAGLRALIVKDVPLPFPVEQALMISQQAQFHPTRYVQGLAQKIISDRCQIFENSKVVEIDEEQKMVRTAAGTVRAQKIIHATHTPKGFSLLQLDLYPYREYGIAGRLEGQDYPDGIFWSLEEPSHSIRSCRIDGEPYLIVIGENHKTGQHDDKQDYYGNVEAYVRSHFQLASLDYRWSAQGYRTADKLPYIGSVTGAPDIYVATGFGTNGLVYGPLAASLIVNDIIGRPNPWLDLYSAKRFTPGKSATEFVKENINVAGQYVGGFIALKTSPELEGLAPGEGKIAEIGGEKVAAYRDDQGELMLLSPICTHLGCVVNWNALEKSWDCPCHGSRFRGNGEVIEGPAIAGLKDAEA